MTDDEFRAALAEQRQLDERAVLWRMTPWTGEPLPTPKDWAEHYGRVFEVRRAISEGLAEPGDAERTDHHK